MLNTTNASKDVGNVVRNGHEKCVFLYNANRNEFRDNWFESCLAFRYLNTQLVPAGTFTGRATYTLTAP